MVSLVIDGNREQGVYHMFGVKGVGNDVHGIQVLLYAPEVAVTYKNNFHDTMSRILPAPSPNSSVRGHQQIKESPAGRCTRAIGAIT